MTCYKCGAEVPEGKAFCADCGAKVNENAETDKEFDEKRYTVLEYNPNNETNAVSPSVKTDNSTVTLNTSKKNGDNKKRIVVISVAAALVVIAVALAVIIPKLNDKKDKDNATDQTNSNVIKITEESSTESTLSNDDLLGMVDDDTLDDLFSDSNTDNTTEPKTEANTDNTEAVTEKSLFDSKVVGIWKITESFDDEGYVIDVTLLIRFYDNGTYKLRVDETSTSNSFLEAYYEKLSVDLGLTTKEEIDRVLASEGINLSDIAKQKVKEYAEVKNVDGYWKTENGTMYMWEKGEKVADATKQYYAVTEQKMKIGDKIYVRYA